MLPPTLTAARVEDAMTHGVIQCRPETPLRRVAALMASKRIHAVYVLGDTIWGLVSDLDLVAAGRGDIDRLTARDAAVTPLVTVEPEDSLDRAAQLLAERGVSHLAVVDPFSRAPVGVVSTLDIARLLAEDSPRPG